MNLSNWRILLVILISSFDCSYGQEPFDCNGRSYRVLAANDGTYLQEIKQNISEQTISFVNLHFYSGIEINAIAYHPSQNVIYGILQDAPYRLCRIDASYDLQILQTLPLSDKLVFVSGDISPDEQHLVIFGFGDTNTENIVALIDVETEEYETEVFSFQTSNSRQPFIYCADIAFHPTTGKLFGFDFKNGRLVMLDIANRVIDNETYPLSSIVLGNVPSIFFNDRGELFGIGTNLQEETENRGYFKFDLATGQPKLFQELEIEKNQDACSCPYRIKLLNGVRQRENAPCTELVFEITMINRTIAVHKGLTLNDTFPEGVEIKSIDPLPFEGVVESSIGTNILEISDLELPVGEFSFEVILEIDERIRFGEYENQAFLSGLTIGEFELDRVLSDDPQTAVPDDATKFSINELSTSIGDQFYGICPGGEVTLHAGIYNAIYYQWSTGETTEEITVDTEGEYEIKIGTACDEAIGIATVTMDEISLDIGEDRLVQSGETITLRSLFDSQSNIRSFGWQATNSQSLDCPSCRNLVIQPSSDTDINLSIENATGCRASDQLSLKVVGVNIYAPNIFRPVGNGENSRFFLLGNLTYDIAQFEVYDRWGNLMFHNKNLLANDMQQGWDGTYKDQLCPQGVYVWTAVIRYKSGVQEVISGDVTLMR